MAKLDPGVVLVVGSGGREHALAAWLARSEGVLRILVAPGNGGTARERKCQNVAVKETDIEGLLALATAEKVGLTVVGPEDPLALGIVDRFRDAGFPIFGPTQAAARLETSKVWAREFMTRHNIPCPAYTIAEDPDAAEAAVRALGGRCVVKADGLAAGKGVAVCDGVDVALAAVKSMLVDRQFGEAGARVLVEERLTGLELSVMVVSDGTESFRLLPAQDFKRLLDDDQGPNTGGMGAFAPSPVATRAMMDTIRKLIIDPTIAGMAAEGTPFTGCLYCGLMLTEDGPKVIEYNVRFGDPETQVQLPLLDSDLFRLLKTAAAGSLHGIQVGLNMGRAAVCVVLASQGYPAKPLSGFVIRGLVEGPRDDGVQVFHAGTNRVGTDLVTAGGRVLCVVSAQDTVEEARAAAYNMITESGIQFRGMQYRTDIAAGIHTEEEEE